jgi:hypothetical protein
VLDRHSRRGGQEAATGSASVKPVRGIAVHTGVRRSRAATRPRSRNQACEVALPALDAAVAAIVAAADRPSWSLDEEGSVPRLAHGLKGGNSALGATALAQLCHSVGTADLGTLTVGTRWPPWSWSASGCGPWSPRCSLTASGDRRGQAGRRTSGTSAVAGTTARPIAATTASGTAPAPAVETSAPSRAQLTASTQAG